MADLKPIIAELRAISSRLSEIANQMDAPIGTLTPSATEVDAGSSMSSSPSVIAAPPVVGSYNAFGPAELQTKLKSVKSGDIIVAKKGPYGNFPINNINPSGFVQVDCEAGSHFERLYFTKSSKIGFSDLVAYPLNTVFPSTGIVMSDSVSSDLSFFGGKIMSAADAENYYGWDIARWKSRATRGIQVIGPRCRIDGVSLIGLRIGTIVGADDSLVKNCRIRGVSEDATRIVGDGPGSAVLDCDKADFLLVFGTGVHPDGGQDWSVLGTGGPGSGKIGKIVRSGNLIREWIGPSNHPIPHKTQGIGLHDGTYGDVIVEDNEIWLSAVPGIDIKRADTVTVRRNKVFNIDRKQGDFAKITLSVGKIISEDNIANRYNYALGKGDQVANYADTAMVPQMPMHW